MKFTKNTQKTVAVGSGIIFLIIILVLAMLVPRPTTFQYTVFRIILALAASGFAATIPGFLEVSISGIARSTGAIAVFLIVYFFSPAGMVINDSNSNKILGPKMPMKFVALTELPGIQASFQGNVIGGIGELKVDISLAKLTFPKASPDGGNRFIPYYRICLAESEENSWKITYKGEKQKVEQTLEVGESLLLGSEKLKLALPGMESLANCWLVFEVGVSVSEDERIPGTTYAHASPSLF